MASKPYSELSEEQKAHIRARVRANRRAHPERVRLYGAVLAQCERCGMLFMRRGNQVRRSEHQYCSLRCRNLAYKYTASEVITSFWQRVVKRPEECWIWQGARNRAGYGTVYVGTRVNQLAHRFAYEHQVGALLPTHDLHHMCGNKLCVNPAHLQVLTKGEHIRLEYTLHGNASSRKTHCPYGHEYTPENTAYTKRGGRYCLACNRVNGGGRLAALFAPWRQS